MEYLQRTLKSLHSDYTSYVNTGEMGNLSNTFEKKWSNEKARSKRQLMRQSWLPGLCQLAYYVPEHLHMAKHLLCKLSAHLCWRRTLLWRAPEIGLQRCSKADTWLTALERLKQPKLHFYKWLVHFLHLFGTSKLRVTIIFRDYFLLVQPELLFRDQGHLALTQNKRQSRLQKFKS